MAGAVAGAQRQLSQLHNLLSRRDSKSASVESHNVVTNLSHDFLDTSSESRLALLRSLIFSKDQGLLIFLRKSLSNEDFRDCREEVLKLVTAFVEKIKETVGTHACEIKDTCLVIYTKERFAKCKTAALDLLLVLLRSKICLQEFKIGQMFNKFYGELAQKNKLSDTVLEKIYELLGVLAEVKPAEMLENSEKLYRAFLSELKTQMTSATKKPKLLVVSGCLRGLMALMVNFTKSREEDPQTSKNIFDYALKAINRQFDMKRYAVPIAALRLFALHSNQFSTYLMDNCQTLFEAMSICCGHTNNEMKKAAYSALESFLKEIALQVKENAHLHEDKLQYFMQQFYKIIRTMESSNKELSIAIRGYGLFAAPCKAVNSQYVDFMYIELIQRCKQMYLTEADTEDDNIYQLPSFLDSISSVIFHIDKIPGVYTSVLERLIVVQIDGFPQYSTKMQPVCCHSIVKLFLALAEKGPVLWNFISTVVHQGLIRVCSKPILLLREGMENLGPGSDAQQSVRNSGVVTSGNWRVPSYKDYLDLFRILLDCEKMKVSGLVEVTFQTIESPLKSLNHLLYDEFIKSVLKIIEKLDMSVDKQSQSEDGASGDGNNGIVIPTSDPTAKMQPTKPKDFIAFINLVEFCGVLLLEKHTEYFEHWMYRFGHELILRSTQFPLVSGFYKLLSVAMKIAKKIKYFKGVCAKSGKQCHRNAEKFACFALFAKFGKEVATRMKQYKDELLASCLIFVLSLPHEIIELDVKTFIPALQTTFKLGLSHIPLANAGLDALEDWSAHLSKQTIQPYYKEILPHLDGFLKTSVSSEFENNWDITRIDTSTKGGNKFLIRHLKKSTHLSMHEESPLATVRRRVVWLLGCLGGQINRSLVTAASFEEMMKKCVAWVAEKALSFAVPFADMKPVIYLDSFLPRISELALAASDRQTKVAACELLHSVVAYMLGKGSQISEGQQETMYQLNRRVYPVLLRLGCDLDKVTSQLFEPLVMQLIHWLTNNTKFESRDTVALLETILDGIVDPEDSTLRDFCGKCVKEFLKWSIKQTTTQQQQRSPVNTKSLFKRLYSLALHPNTFRRLGAALAFNNVYREFREENALVDQFVFEILVVYVESLALAHVDDKSLGTIQQCSDVIDHLKRIIKQKARTLNIRVKRRVPRGFCSEQMVCLTDVVLWLLVQCGRPQTECRHKCMVLFYELVPYLPGNQTPSSWLDGILKENDISFLINKFEGAGNENASCSGIISNPTLNDLQDPFSVRATVQWMDMLLAALDCYNTFIGLHILKANELLGTSQKSGFLKAINFFLKNLAMNDIGAAEKCFAYGIKGILYSPREKEEYSYSKCTIIVRIMEFVSMVLENCQQDFWKVLEKDLLNSNLFELIAVVVADPTSVGFNMADVQVMKDLPDRCVRLLKAVVKSPYSKMLEDSMRKRITTQSIEDLCSVDLYSQIDHNKLSFILSACKQLYKAELLNSVLKWQTGSHSMPLNSKLLSAVYKGMAPGDERKSLPSIDVSSKMLADGLLQLSFSLEVECKYLVSLLLNTVELSVPLSGASQRNFIRFFHGEYFYNLFPETINTELLRNLNSSVALLMASASENSKMVSIVLNGLLDQSFRDHSVRKKQGILLVNAVLNNWLKLESWWSVGSSPENKMAALTLLSKVLQIDSSVSSGNSHEAFDMVFHTYTTILTDSTLALNLKTQAVIILPFFTQLPEENLAVLQTALDQFVAAHFPMKSDEFPKGTLRYNNYIDCIKRLLDALELSQSPLLFKLMTAVLCRDSKHVMEEAFQNCFQKIAKRGSCAKQVALMETAYEMFGNEELLPSTTRQFVMNRSLLTLASHCSQDALIEFLCKIVKDAMGIVQSRFIKLSESSFDSQLTKKIGCYKLFEVAYTRLPKRDVHSDESKLIQAFHTSGTIEGNKLSKILLKFCHDAVTENMAGETQLLEKRRQYHCAAYNCIISILCCIFTEAKFYQGFLFSEKPEKNIFIFENLIDIQRTYNFPVEIEVPVEKKKRYFAIRKEARDAAEGDSDEPHYLSSLSYMADSSLSEEMSQFDFSTGVQSFTYNSQDSTMPGGHSRKKDWTELGVVQNNVVELEMDEMNEHECMATMTALINHMQKTIITLKPEENKGPHELPSWMKFLHGKLGNPSTALNIRLFIAKLIVNTEEIFQPYAQEWLGPLLQLVVSGNNGGDGIHYMVVEIVVTLLSWSSVATPKGNPKNEILANRLLEFLMKNCFHDKRPVFRHNLEIIKTVVECWKDCLSIPYSLIFDRFAGKNPNAKDNSVGIQLLGIVLANNFPPYDPKCEIDSERYFQRLAQNISFTRYKEVYGAAAEVFGLVLQHLADKKIDIPIHDTIAKELQQLHSTKEDKFIVCLSKIVKHFPPFADRFLNAVFFLLPKLYGVLKTHCLEVVMHRAEEIPDIYLQLKSKDFVQILGHRDEERQKVSLDILYKIVAKLKPVELKELVSSVTAFISHPSPICRERMYDTLKWIHDNYRDPESQSDPDSKEIFKIAKNVLLQGLTDENPALQLYVRNFWSHESRLPVATLQRMLAILGSLYCNKIEMEYLSIATNVLLEMTSHSPDYSREMFEYPLSECKFQDYSIDSSWYQRSRILTPLFVETQATQSSIRSPSQEASSAGQKSFGQIRATLTHYEFTPSQNPGARNFNWLTGSSLDTFAEYSLPSSELLSSSLFVYSKWSEKPRRAALKTVGPDFGKKRLALPGDEVDSKTKVADQRADILRLRRRFLKDREKETLIFARRNIEEKYRATEIKTAQEMKRDAAVTLYRRYRVGDLPDIQIKFSSLIAPLQAVAQKDHSFAKQLFSALFSGILEEVKKFKTTTEINSIAKELTQNFSFLLSSTTSCFPPFVACIQDMSFQHPILLNLDPALISSTSLVSLQQPMGILLLELSLMHHTPQEEPPAKRARGTKQHAPDTNLWVELAKLYRSIGDYDVLHGIFSEKIGTKPITQKALLAEAKNNYVEAVRLYEQALISEQWEDGDPTDAEKDFWDIAVLECYNQLTEWKSLEYCSIVNVSDKTPVDLEEMWTNPFYQEIYLPYMMRSKVKLLQLGEADQSLLTFIDNAMKVDQRKTVIESRYSLELSLLYILQDDFDRAKYYANNSIDIFMQNYSSIDVLLHKSRLSKLQSLQTLTEIQDFLQFITKGYNLTSEIPLRKLIKTWTQRYPESKMDPMSIWDDVITNRCFFLDKIKERLSPVQADDSMEVDDEGAEVKMEVEQEEEDLDLVIRDCKFNMKLRMIESASKQNNFSVSTKLLKELVKESKARDDWRVKWIHSYSRYRHRHSRNLGRSEQIVTMMKNIPLLVETKVEYLNTHRGALRDQNTLLGTTYHIMANALVKDPLCLQHIEAEQVREVITLSEATDDDAAQITIGLFRKAYKYLQRSVKKSEEEVQSLPEEHVETAGVIEAYMNLATFCDKCLCEEEESENIWNFPELQTFPACVVENMLKALKYNSQEARLRFPRLLQIVELYPSETQDLMAREVSSIPCWQFIGWISQMMAVLDKKEACVVQNIIEEIADSYPQAVVYPFMISSENFTFEPSANGNRNREFVERLKSKLDKGGVIERFIHSLEQLSNPDLLFKDWVNDFLNHLGKEVKNENLLKNKYDEMYSNLASFQAPGIGGFRRKYVQIFKQDFDKYFGEDGHKLLTMDIKTFKNVTSDIEKHVSKLEAPGNLKEYSPWMSEFKPEYLRNELEIPGQYDGKSKPLPEYHAHISGFDERIKVMHSIRKPKRLIIRGNDEKDHPFLVKGGEDLRQDQRIEQLFETMNVVLSRDAACSQRNLQLKTYQVIPMTSRLGLIEWLDNTCVFRDFLTSSMTEEEQRRKQEPRDRFENWLLEFSRQKEDLLIKYLRMYKNANRIQTVKAFRDREQVVPQDLLRRAFTRMSTTPEAFLTLRSHFASSHALMCVSHWILGIGDRHLSNFMINLETGGMVGIDFGHAFGSATQFLSVPELMPFRLTPQFLNLMLPMKESGLIYNTMVHGLRAFRLDPDLLLSTMDVFVKEPSLDWKNLEQKQLQKKGTWIKDVKTNEINWYPMQKVNCAKKKLEGANPSLITREELRLGHEKSEVYKNYIAVTKGDERYNIRAREPDEGLSVEQQVECLIDQATDPNILGRVWIGWEAWM